MSDNKMSNFTKNMLKVGTPECAIFFAAVAMVLALLFLSVGFWQTLLIAALVVLGLFIGGVKDKKEWLRTQINKLFPARQNVPYRARNDEIQRAVKAVQEAKEAREAAEKPAAPIEHTDTQN